MFEYLDKGGSVTALIPQFDLSVDDAEHIVKRYNGLKELEKKSHHPPEKDDEVQKLERDLKLGELRRRKLEQEKPLQLETALTGIQTTISHQGSWKKKNCSHFQDNYCREWSWSSKPTVSYQIGQPLEKDAKWFINPDFVSCAACPLFHQQGALSIQDVNTKVNGVEGRVNGVQSTVVGVLNALNNTPDCNIRNRHKCASCGATRLVAVKTVCTSCGADTGPWGFFPKKKK